MAAGILGGRDPEEIAEAIHTQYGSDAQSAVHEIARKMAERVPGGAPSKHELELIVIDNIGPLIRKVVPGITHVSFDEARLVLVSLRKRLRVVS